MNQRYSGSVDDLNKMQKSGHIDFKSLQDSLYFLHQKLRESLDAKKKDNLSLRSISGEMGVRFAGETCKFKKKLNEKAYKDEFYRQMQIIENKKKFRDTIIGNIRSVGPGPSEHSMEAAQQDLRLKPK